MKKLNLIVFGLFMLFIIGTPFQKTVADTVPLKDDNKNTEVVRARTPIRLPLTVEQNETDITLDFTYSVGIAQITVEDEFGGVVYQEALDTTENPFLLIETSDWDGGNYKLKVSYGSINLSGEFSL